MFPVVFLVTYQFFVHQRFSRPLSWSSRQSEGQPTSGIKFASGAEQPLDRGGEGGEYSSQRSNARRVRSPKEDRKMSKVSL